MKLSLAEVVSEFKHNWTRVIEEKCIEQICHELDLQWRNRVLSPARTVHLLLLQVLHGNTAINHLRMFTGRDFSASAYCQARTRLPLKVMQQLLVKMSAGLRRSQQAAHLWFGRRVYLVDGSTFSMPDTDGLRNHFGQHSGQSIGCGFPMAHFVALFHAGTGMLMEVLSGSLFAHDLSQFIKLHPALRRSDIIVGDRNFCSYSHIALMCRRGVDAVLRLHSKQIVNFRPGRKYSAKLKGLPRSRWEKKLGVRDQIVTWFKPESQPLWMNANQYRLIPSTLRLREIAYDIQARGFRTRRVFLVTTLLDHKQFSAAAIANLYGHRWTIETNFRHLKITLGMDILHCKTVLGVLKEFYAFCLVYNLVRTTMLQAAKAQKCDIDRISFIDAIRWIIQACHKRNNITLRRVPKRPGRAEPRALKRRPKQFDLLNKPRYSYKLLRKFA